MPKKTPGQYFLSKGISPSMLTERLERLLPLEREVLLARAWGKTLHRIAQEVGLTTEGVRQVEHRSLAKLRSGQVSPGLEGQRFRLAVEQRWGLRLEQVVARLPEKEQKLILAYVRGDSLAGLAPGLGLSIAAAASLRDQGVARLLGEERGSRAGRWAELKAAVVAALRQRPLTYAELKARFPMSRRRLMRLMQELVMEGRAELSGDYPFRFLALEAVRPARPRG